MNITSKYRSLSVQAKAALWFTICSFLQKGISFITVPIFTRLMSTEEYGTYTVYLSWLQILTIMTSLYLFNGVYDNAMAKYEKQRDEYTSAMQGLTLVITGAVFALYCFTSGFWEKILNLPKSMILHTGGLPSGAISTRSSPASNAIRSAFSMLSTPICAPSALTTRTSFALISSLINAFLLITDTSKKNKCAWNTLSPRTPT